MLSSVERATHVSKSKTAEAEVSLDRRAKKERRAPDRRTEQVAVVVERRKLERREKVSRRRQIDPTTCERDYSTEEIEFMHALDRYKAPAAECFPRAAKCWK